MNVSSGTGSPGESRTKGHKMVVVAAAAAVLMWRNVLLHVNNIIIIFL